MNSRFPVEHDAYQVTALTGCLRRSYFQRTSFTEETVESAWAKLRGSLLHYVDRSFGWSELRVKMKFDFGGAVITVVGHIDAYDPETATIYDLKTTRFVKWQAGKGFLPRESHVAQIQSYHTLLDRYGIPVARLVLVYVDDRDILAKQVQFGNRKEWMIQRATTLHRCLAESELPKTEIGEECGYCQFINACPRQVPLPPARPQTQGFKS